MRLQQRIPTIMCHEVKKHLITHTPTAVLTVAKIFSPYPETVA